MTTDEIKSTTSMRDILIRYGLQANRAGMIRCPFHSGDNTASMKIYDGSFYCFGCGIGGDIFRFVMEYEGVDFKTAFRILGGTYANGSKEERRKASLMVARRKMQAETERRKAERKRRERYELNKAITIYRQAIETVEPMSDLWARWTLTLCEMLQRLEMEDDG